MMHMKEHTRTIIIKLTCLLTMSFLLLSLATNVQANESRLPEAPIFIDGEPINTRFLMREGHILVPALFFKHTGAYVDWNADYRSVVYQVRDIMFAAPIGKRFTDDYVRSIGTWIRNPLSIEPIEFAGEPFVPLLDVARKLGMNTRYDFALNRTFITTNINVAPNTIQRANTSQKLIALTFDDGPESYYTPQILDILKEKGVSATFFVMGKQIRLFPEEMKRIVADGHAIANHTNTHPDIRKIWSSKVREEIIATQNEMQRVIGKRPHIFRPPYGAYTKSDVAILNEIGMKNIMWSVDTMDWSGTPADDILAIIHRDKSPGAIVLQHNFQSQTRQLDGTVEALPRIIDELRAEGYTFVTIQTLLDS